MNITSLEPEISLLHERICSALVDTKRIKILFLLSEKSMFVNEISEALSAPQSTISRHLKILRECNLVSTERHRTAILYSLKDKRIIDVLNQMRTILKDQIQTGASKSQPNSE